MVAFFDEPIQTIRGMSVGAALAPGYEVSVAKNPLDKTLTNWPTAAVNPSYDGTGPMLGKMGTNSMYHITDPSAIAAQQALANERKTNTEADESAMTQDLVRKKLGGGEAINPKDMAARMFGTPPDAPGVPQPGAISPAAIGDVEIPGPPSYADYAVTQEGGVQQTQPQRPIRYSEPERSKVAKPGELYGGDQGDATDPGPDRNMLAGLFNEDQTFKWPLARILGVGKYASKE